jgi:hypothetical protein
MALMATALGMAVHKHLEMHSVLVARVRLLHLAAAVVVTGAVGAQVEPLS